MGTDERVTAAGDVSGVRILETATDLARLQRTPASPGYAEAVALIVDRLDRAGVAATVHEYPADGATKTYEWTAPPAWSVRSGRLVQMGPTERVLADFAETAQAVVVHSPGGTFAGEVAHVGSPEADGAYDAVDLAGKVALVCARAGEAVPRAAARGAVAVVVYPDSERAAASHDLVQYQSIFPLREAIAGLVPAFSVSRRTADRLLRAMAKEPISVRGEIDAEFGEGRLQVVEAIVPGTTPASAGVLLTAHLCHPRGSANDNASGAAALVEIARAAAREPLRPGVRLLWMPEFYGSLPWAAAHASELRATEFALNLDMIGASPRTIGEPLRVFRSANHAPHYINACVERAAAFAAAAGAAPRGTTRPLHWSFDLPTGGSDHLVFAAAPHRRPALMLGGDDPYWHTDFDTPDKLDATRLKQAAVLATALAAAAAPDAARAAAVWRDLLAYSAREIARAGGLAGAIDPAVGERLLDLALGVEVARTRTFHAIDASAQAARADLLRAIREHVRRVPPSPRGARDDGPRPVRRIDGPLVYSITDRFTEEERTFFKEHLGGDHRALAEGLLNHCDGTKTTPDIALLLSLDANRLVPVEDVERGVELYRKVGYVA